MAAQYQLTMHSGPTPGKVYPLSGDVIIIGRENESGVVINDAEVSRKHAQFVSQGGKYVLTDLGSTNGTYINGQRLTTQHVMQPGEVISLGEQINLLFELVGTVDPNATVVQSGHSAPPPMPRTVSPQPQYAPPPQAYAPPPPAYQAAPPPPMYAGQVPSGPAPMPAQQAAPAKSGNSPMVMIIIGVILLMLICVCIGALWYIDANKMWCTLFPFLFGSSCG